MFHISLSFSFHEASKLTQNAFLLNFGRTIVHRIEPDLSFPFSVLWDFNFGSEDRLIANSDSQKSVTRSHVGDRNVSFDRN